MLGGAAWEWDALGNREREVHFAELQAMREQHRAQIMKVADGQGLRLVHLSAQREHFWSHVLGCFAGFSDKNGSG
jgi:hypothetical protein